MPITNKPHCEWQLRVFKISNKFILPKFEVVSLFTYTNTHLRFLIWQNKHTKQCMDSLIVFFFFYLN